MDAIKCSHKGIWPGLIIILLFLFFSISPSIYGDSDDDQGIAERDSLSGVLTDSSLSAESMEDSVETETWPEELVWDAPSQELLEETYYTLDSSADARVIQKETWVRLTGKRNNRTLKSAIKKRIKIYTERGLTYANYKHTYFFTQSLNDNIPNINARENVNTK